MSAEQIAAALNTLRAAGWSVQESNAYGHLAFGLVHLRYGPEGRHYQRVTASSPWTPALEVPS